MVANGVLNEVWTTSRARLGMRDSIKVRFLDFRSVTFTFSSSMLKVPLVSVVTAHMVYFCAFTRSEIFQRTPGNWGWVADSLMRESMG